MAASAPPPPAAPPDPDASPRASLFSQRRVRVAFLVAFGIATLLLAYRLRSVLNPFLIALLIAYILQPVIQLLERRARLPRTAAVVTLYIAGAGIATAAILYSIGQTSNELDRLLTKALGGWQRVEEPAAPPAPGAPAPPARESPVYGADQLLPLPSSPSIAFLDVDQDGQRGPREPLFQRPPEGGRWALVPPTVDAASHEWRWKPGLLDDIKGWVAQNTERLDPKLMDALVERAKANAAFIAATGADLWRWATDELFGGILTFFGYFALVPIYAFFLMRGYDSIVRSVDEHLPGVSRERVRAIARRIDRACASFFRGRFLVCVGKGLFVSLGLWLIGVDFALTIGLVTGALALIPALGVILGFALAAVFSYGPEGYGLRLIQCAVLFATAEGLEAIANPLVLGREVGLHPITIIIALFAFGDLFGLFGVLLAVPLAAIAKILAQELVLPELRHLAAERPAPAAAALPPPAPPLAHEPAAHV